MDGVADVWRGRRVLVTGASGVVGSWLVKALLARGADVVAFVIDADPQTELYRSGDVSRCAVVNGNLEDFRALERAVNVHETDTVFHLGAQTLVGVASRAPLLTFETNVRGTWSVLEACRQYGAFVKRLIIASSDKAYGAQAYLPYTEDMPLIGTHPYEASKVAVEIVGRSYHTTFGVPLVFARCGNIYGGGDLNWTRLVPGTIRSVLRGERPVIRSDGTFVRDYLYVKDAVDAYLSLAEQLENPAVCGRAFNFSTETPTRVLDAVRSIRAAIGRLDLEPIIEGGGQGEIREQHLSAAKAHAVLGWKPQYDLQRGLDETIAWYRQYLRV